MFFNPMKLGDDILSKREKLGLSYREASLIIGISIATLHRAENYNDPDINTFGRLCDWLKTNPNKYFDNGLGRH